MAYVKSYKPVSRILSWAIIYLSRQLPVGINLPTLYLERAVLKRYYTWHFSMQGLPANNVTIISRRLLPYVFTFVPICIGIVIFCGTVCFRFRLKRNKTRLFTGALLCAVRTFLPDYIGTIAWLVAVAKIISFIYRMQCMGPAKLLLSALSFYRSAEG